MDKEEAVHIYNGTLFSHKKNGITPFATPWMNLEMIILSEVSQTKTNIIYHLYVESLTNDINEIIYKTEIDS